MPKTKQNKKQKQIQKKQNKQNKTKKRGSRLQKKAFQKNSKSKIETLIVNCDGIANKIPDLNLMVETHGADIIIATESKLDSSVLSPEVTYTLWLHDGAEG